MKKYISLFFVLLLIVACGDEPMQPNVEPTVVLDETPYEFSYGDFPAPDLPEDNPLTVAGVELGRMLFYEKKLSKGDEQSCASCHNQANGFSDTLKLSVGVEGLEGTRQAMGVFNMAWNSNEFFWDGRAHLLRDQSLLPIEDELELNETHENVISKLSLDKLYRDQFTKAFGDDEITTHRMSLAMEQFMLSIVSVDSKYDRYLAGEVTLTESEERGRALYFAEYNPFFPEVSGADCEHCHGGINLENDQYMNNGLDADAKQTDVGREAVTMLSSDKAKFKVPTLRNIALTPPYMHDGRFKTLEEVIDHYNDGIKMSATIDPALIQVVDQGLLLDAQDKKDLVAFLHTLTDETFVNDERYTNPFE